MNKNERFDIFSALDLDDINQKLICKSKMMSDIISELIVRRINMNLSQRDLAQLTGIKQPMIARIETFKTTPRLDTLITLANELDMEIKAVRKNEEMKRVLKQYN